MAAAFLPVTTVLNITLTSTSSPSYQELLPSTTMSFNTTMTSSGQVVTSDLNQTFDMRSNITQLLIERLGERRRETVSAVILTVVYTAIFLSGILGNVCTCIVITRNSSMRTTTNCYLFSLAVSDILLIVFGKSHFSYFLFVLCTWLKLVVKL